jgi:hypothetical protein
MLSFARSTVSTCTLGAALALAAGNALAAGAVSLQNWGDGAGAAPAIGAGETLNVVKSLPKSNYADNPSLAFSAWAHAGGSPWWAFQVTETVDATVRLATVDTDAEFKPAFTVWASGDTMFDGGTESGIEFASNGWGTPHSFNATGQIGSLGTYWAGTDGVTTFGNLQQTLAYALTGPAHAADTTGWGETLSPGVNDVSIDDTFEKGVSGSTGANWAEISFAQLQPGWYVIFAGGSDDSLTAQNASLSVTTMAPVPEPGTWALMAGGLALIAGLRRRSLRA